MPTDIFLTRKSAGQWVKYDQVIDVTLTGSTQFYSGVTADHTTGIFTIPGASLIVNQIVVFESLTGGTGLNLSMPYYVIAASGGTTCQLALQPGGTATTFSSDVTAGTISLRIAELQVWSTGYRDIFNFNISPPVGGSQTAGIGAENWNQIPLGSTSLRTCNGVVATEVQVNNAGEVGVLAVGLTNSDDINHSPIRQTLLNYTAWRFDRGSSVTPRYLYAMWQDGDIIADNPPQTP